MAAAQPAATVAAPALRILALIAAPLVARQGADITPVTALAVAEELDAIVDDCTAIPDPTALEIEVRIATAEVIGEVFATNRQPIDLLHFTGPNLRSQ